MTNKKNVLAQVKAASKKIGEIEVVVAGALNILHSGGPAGQMASWNLQRAYENLNTGFRDAVVWIEAEKETK